MSVTSRSADAPWKSTERISVGRWWVAGLLVGCLIPMSASTHAETPQPRPGAWPIGAMVALIWQTAATKSRQTAIQGPRWPPLPVTKAKPQALPALRQAKVPSLVAALDAMSRRGPPGIALPSMMIFYLSDTASAVKNVSRPEIMA